MPAAIILGILVNHAAHAQCHYRVTILPTLDCGDIGQDGGTPYALNDFGQVAGKHSHCLGSGESPFVWTGGPTIGTIPLPQGVVSAQAFAISNLRGTDGVGMVGGQAETSNGQYRPFIWFNGQWQFLPFGENRSPGGVFAINDHGLAVGYTTNAAGNWVATYWIDGQPQFIQPTYGPRSIATAVNQSGAIVGWMGPAVIIDSHAFLFDNSTITDIGAIPGGVSASALAINDRSEVVIRGSLPAGNIENLKSKMFRWKCGDCTDLGILRGYNTFAVIAGINEHTTIVGYCTNTSVPGNPSTGWIWRDGTLSNLSSLLVLKGNTPVIGTAQSVNNNGQIVAQASIGSGGTLTGVTVILTPVPDSSGDTNCDGLVNMDDLLNVITTWGLCSGPFCPADLDSTGTVDVLDLETVLNNWTFQPR